MRGAGRALRFPHPAFRVGRRPACVCSNPWCPWGGVFESQSSGACRLRADGVSRHRYGIRSTGNDQPGNDRRTRPRCAGRGGPGRARHGATDRHRCDDRGNHRHQRSVSLSVSENRALRAEGEAARVQGTRADAGVERRIRVRSSDHARRRRHRYRRDRPRRHSLVGNGRSQIVRHRAASRGPEPADERAQFLDLALLVPGVSPTNTNSTQLFAETSALPGQGLSIASQRNLSNSFIVDGLSANDDAAGLSGIPFGVDAIEQFQVVTGGGQAELGRALGGYVNVVTRSGTNTLQGTRVQLFPR